MPKQPRYSREELWEAIRAMHKKGQRFYSVVRRHAYRIASLSKATRTYTVQYESGNTPDVPFQDLYAIYAELYRLGEMRRDYLRNETNGQRIIGHARYSGSPGATIFGVLANIDDHIDVEPGGHLRVC